MNTSVIMVKPILNFNADEKPKPEKHIYWDNSDMYVLFNQLREIIAITYLNPKFLLLYDSK